MTDRKELKRLAREAIRETKPSPVLVTLVVTVILGVTQLLALKLNGDLDAYIATAKSFAAGQLTITETAVNISPLAVILGLALDLMSMAVSMGYTLYALRVSRRANPGFGDVFDVFGMFIRVIVLTVVRSMIVSLCSFIYSAPATMLGMVMDPVAATLICLPLMAPMFVVMYAYRLADFILLDNPRYPAIQCLGLSRLAMKGRKWEMFKLDLSFLGWIVLCLFPPVWLWVRPYMSVTVAEYYDAVMSGFWEWLRSQPVPTPTARSGFGNPGSWSIPGERPDGGGDDAEDDDDADDEM